jgi:GntR family transcriptional regulator
MADPMYRQIADDLRGQIESGDLEPGQQLRTELELREHYKASRNTVRDAIKWLTTLGLVETHPGQGTFVVKRVDPFVTTLTRKEGEVAEGGQSTSVLSELEKSLLPVSSDVRVEIQGAPEHVATQLRLAPGDEVISRHEQRHVVPETGPRRPYSLQTSFYPVKFADDGADRLRSSKNIEEGAVQYLRETLGIKQVGYRDWITVRAPNEVEAGFFKVPTDGRIAMFEISRVAFDGNGNPMRLTVTVLPADRNQLAVNVGEVPPLQPATQHP